MKKHIIREIPAEHANFEYYFDGEMWNENSGDYNNYLFIVTYDRERIYGYNIDEYKRIDDQMEDLYNAFCDVETDKSYYNNYKEAMTVNHIEYTPAKCHALKEWFKNSCSNGFNFDSEDTANFLTITTGKEWDCIGVSGYCQDDYVNVIFCTQNNSRETAETCGKLWLGCGKEYCVIDIDENGNEIESVYGYYVSDSQSWHTDIKKLISEWADIDPEETTLEEIDGYTTRTIYNYKTVS